MRCTAIVIAAAFMLEANAQGLHAHLYHPGVVRLSEVLGIEVLTPEGRPLGRITELYFDRASGRVEEVAVGAARYPVGALVSAEAPGQVVLETTSPGFAAAGASALVPISAGNSLSAASRELGSPEAVLVDLLQGRVRPGL
jgi:sporulation protein YlmC with PRC-barrel domain